MHKKVNKQEKEEKKVSAGEGKEIKKSVDKKKK